MKKMFLSLIGVAVFIVFVGLLTKTNQGEKTIFSRFFPKSGSQNQNAPQSGSNQLKGIQIGNTNILVQLANTDETRAKGLGGVTDLAVNQGMLFVFSSKDIVPSFWMKGMKIPLDIIWINDNKVTQIDANVPTPIPNTADSRLPVYRPMQPIDYVLEVNAGFSARNNIKVGDELSGLQ